MPDEPGAYASANGIQLWYRDEGKSDGEPLLLIMGLNSQLILWPDEIVAALGEHGFRVIRFDNRDCGLSSRIKSDTDDRPPLYHLADMAEDTVGLLDHLGIEQAHVVGASMGGMIAQLVAIHHPGRVRTLCSIMSTTGNPLVGQPSEEAREKLLAPTPDDRDEAIEHITDIFRVIGSKTHADAEEARRRHLAEASYDRSFYPQGTKNQFAAILHARNRTADLGRLTMPTLVIHGAEDSLINITGGQATHKAIPGSEYTPHADMGHDLPEVLWPKLVDDIVANAHRTAEPDAVSGNTIG
ncbi:alpha/beta fold hydrolase [Kibdelosporangium phytohabitans]|uniref:Alpha/beta hydrolase n=1 Tax=Kibdelosporangium phytohabitans TaxID=860235 RepID=A0A0N9IBH2_9PSEU|nr:alpha/beta fold hydrolase [Kibdelosporangium phytohabitans]ALG12187.1 alpha/beta hydrolase [Kibdelosporangium phytohabitans]MBE1463716.1 pimeloyl-ACP methyl ester carboxylesterase [Kibdelosporangium phytohabitans]